jgi:hypothetical protein
MHCTSCKQARARTNTNSACFWGGREQIFLWMGDHLAAFFALPPSQLLVGKAGGVGRGGRVSRPPLLGSARGRAGIRVGGRGAFAAGREAHTALNNANSEVAPKEDSARTETPVAASVSRGRQNVTGSSGGRGARGARGGRGGGSARRGGYKSQAATVAKNTTGEAKGSREMLWDGKNAGKFPNMMWRAVSMEDLRLHPHFVGLPEPEAVVVEGPLDYRQFQQGSRQWCLLHDGRLTTSRMAPILGIYEPLAQGKLGVPRSLSGHHKVMEAYFHLIRPPCTAADLTAQTLSEIPPAEGGRTGGDALVDMESIGEHKSRGARRRARGKKKAQVAPPAPARAGTAGVSHAETAGTAAAGGVWREAGAGKDREKGFSHAYMPVVKADGPAWRVESAGHARMIWGNTQVCVCVCVCACVRACVSAVAGCCTQACPRNQNMFNNPKNKFNLPTPHHVTSQHHTA